MSRIGNKAVAVPECVTVDIDGQNVRAKGPKGELSLVVHEDVSVTREEDGSIRLSPKSDSLRVRKLWPTMRSLVNNIVIGVSEGYKKELEIKGVGYRAKMQGKTINMQLGFSHDVNYEIPEGVEVKVDGQTSISVSGIDKQKVGQVAAKIRGFKPPEPYKGKGIMYKGEYVIRKEGKKK